MVKVLYIDDHVPSVINTTSLSANFGYNSPKGQEFQQKWLNATENDWRVKNLTLEDTLTLTRPYYCAKTIVTGLDQFLRKNQQYTPEMLANGSLTDKLTPSVFANTGFDGVSGSPVTLGADGNLESDGALNMDLEISCNSSTGVILATLSAIGILTSSLVMTIILINRRKKVFKAMSPLYSVIYCVGALLADVSILFSIGDVNKLPVR
ncbi:hypothetical protein HDU76_013873 [Blyttiomyces sp. JEL0837]|nr:hypothetical protein HDU76_013873 [Blyttiomyces sp. JEL0837]